MIWSIHKILKSDSKKLYLSNWTRTEPARKFFTDRKNTELELNINKLNIYEQFYEIFLGKKYQEKKSTRKKWYHQ